MSRKIKWGVLGTADIARCCTIPGMKKAENCCLYGIAGRSKDKVDRFKKEFGFEKSYYSLDEMLEDENIEAVYIPLPNTLHKEWVLKKDKVDRFKKEFGFEKSYYSLDEMLEDENIEAVYIPLPNTLHKEWVLKAAAKGKHILCEKPLSGTEADVKEMVDACEKAGVVFMEAFAYLHSPLVASVKETHILCEKPLSGTEADVKEMVDACEKAGVVFMEAFAYLHSPLVASVKETLASGEIGALSFMESIFITPGYTPENIRVRRETLGGSVYDLGCYCTSLMLTLFGEELSFMESIFITPGYTPENIRVRRETLGGSVYDLGCYCTSLMLTLFGEEPKEVKAVGHFTDQNIDDFASAYFQFDENKRACMVSGMCSPQRGDRFFLYGTEGTIEAPVPFNADGELTYYVKKGDTCQEIHVTARDNYCLEVEQLGNCIIKGEQPHVSHEFSLRNARVMDKILKEIGY